MSESNGNDIETLAYRFIDDGSDDAVGDSATSFEVEFYPSIEDFVHISEIHAKAYPLPSLAKISLQTFFSINLVGLSAVLWYFDMFVAGLIVFALNLAIAIIFIPAIAKMDYRRYYHHFFPDFEKEIVRIRLTTQGIACQHMNDSSFSSWKNIKSIEETKNSIFFYMSAGRGIAVQKSGFAYDSEKDAFIKFANRQLHALVQNDAPRTN